jgi:hypothetical protein
VISFGVAGCTLVHAFDTFLPKSLSAHSTASAFGSDTPRLLALHTTTEFGTGDQVQPSPRGTCFLRHRCTYPNHFASVRDRPRRIGFARLVEEAKAEARLKFSGFFAHAGHYEMRGLVASVTVAAADFVLDIFFEFPACSHWKRCDERTLAGRNVIR